MAVPNGFGGSGGGDRFGGAFSSGNGSGYEWSGSPTSGGTHGHSQSPASPEDAAPTPPTSPPAGGASARTAAGGSVSGASAAGLNPRSCVTCRRRKVKCDKRNPCGNCVKQHIECVFPRPGRAPRKTKKPPDTELLARLRRLEGVVQKLGRGGAEGGDDGALDTGSASAGPAGSSGTPTEDHRSPSVPDIPEAPPSLSNPTDNPRFNKNYGASAGTLRIDKEMGKLVVGEGKSRYVSNTFWASLTDEVCVGAFSDLCTQKLCLTPIGC